MLRPFFGIPTILGFFVAPRDHGFRIGEWNMQVLKNSLHPQAQSNDVAASHMRDFTW
jgi:hypothetical protein